MLARSTLMRPWLRDDPVQAMPKLGSGVHWTSATENQLVSWFLVFKNTKRGLTAHHSINVWPSGIWSTVSRYWLNSLSHGRAVLFASCEETAGRVALPVVSSSPRTSRRLLRRRDGWPVPGCCWNGSEVFEPSCSAFQRCLNYDRCRRRINRSSQ